MPAATPGILAGLRTALGQAWMAVVASEIFGVPGLGQRMMQASSLLASDVVVIYMLTMAALYGIIDTGFVRTPGEAAAMEAMIELDNGGLTFVSSGRRRDGGAEGFRASSVPARALSSRSLGASGVGKSTLLRVLAGLLPPSGGMVHDATPERNSPLPVVIVFQDARLLPWRKVEANVGFGLEHGAGSIRAMRRKAHRSRARSRRARRPTRQRYPHATVRRPAPARRACPRARRRAVHSADGRAVRGA